MRTEAERLRELLAINRAITGTADYDAVVDLIVDKACVLTEAKASLLLLGETGARAVVVASIGIEHTKLQGFEAVLDERVTTVLRDRLSLGTEGEVIAVPIITRGNLRGILAVVARQPADAARRSQDEWLLSALADQAGIALANAAHLRDTQAALATSRRLADERQVFVSLLDNSSDFIGIADRSGKPIYVNAGGRRMVGLPADFPVEQTQIPEYYPPEERSFAANVIVKSMVEKGHWSGETYFRNWQTGEAIPVSDEHFMIRDASGKRVLGMGTITRDISAARRIRDQLRESEERFRLTLDEAPIGMALVALDGRFVRVNRRLCEIVGYSRAELKRLRFQDITHPEDVDKDVALAAELARGEIPRVELEKRYIRKDGSIVPISLSASILRGHDGEPLYFIAQIEDVSERKRAEEALRASEERLSLGVEAAGLGLWDWNIVADEADLSPRYWELIGRDPGQQRAGLAFFRTVIHPADLPSVENTMAEHLAGRTAQSIVEYRVRKPSGEYVWLVGYGRVAARDRDGRPLRIVGVIVDITERKRRELEQQFLAEVGAAFAESLDYEQTLATVGHLIVRELADWCIIDIVEGGGRTTRLKVVSADPSRASVCAQLERVPLDRSRPNLARPVMETKRPFLVEHVTPELIASVTQSPEHLRLLSALGATSLLGVPLLLHGRFLGIMVLVSSKPSRVYRAADVPFAEAIAERAALAIENGRLYCKAVRATQLRDEVLGVVAHDLRSPLASILMRCTLARRASERGAVPPAFESIERAARRMNRLIHDLLDISTIEAGRLGLDRSRLAAARLASEAVEAQRVVAEAASLRLALDLPAELPDLWADSHRLLQVLDNLITNAIKFTPPGGQITVGASAAAGEVRFWVSDTGRGIPQDELTHVFERFWQARRGDRKGAGLGLPITRGIVEAHGGRIWAESTPGQGTTFFFTVPQASRMEAGPSPRP